MKEIPICPNCKVPTVREQGVSSSTAAYYPPVYDENGVNINPDCNEVTTEWYCYNCRKSWKHKH